MYIKFKPIVSVITVAVVIVLVYITGYIPFDRYINQQVEVFNSTNTEFGYIQPTVIDGFTKEPIEGAIIIIPELDKTFTTDIKGRVGQIKIDIIEDNHFKEIEPKSWGEITLIAYKEGYLDYVLFHTHVWESQGRNGPQITMFKKDDRNIEDPIYLIESPHRLWVKELVDKYRP